MTEVRGGSGIPMSAEIWRKALHLLSLLIPVGLLMLGKRYALTVLVPMAVVAVVIEILRTRSGVVRDLVEKIFGFMMRPEELPPVPAPVRLNGATWVLLTSILLVFLFPPSVAAAAISIGLIGDAAAALVGRKIGKTNIGKSDKTVEGSLAFLVFTAPLVWIVPDLPIGVGIAGIVAGAFVEALNVHINDNFAVPMAAAVAMALILALS